MNYVNWAGRAYECRPGLRTPLHSSLSFDLTITSLWPPLLTGGCIVIIPEDAGLEGLVEALAGQQYGLVKITPSHLRLLKETLVNQSSALVERFVIGGEALTWEELEYWRQQAPAMRLINEYGPTETVVGCCVYEAPPEGEYAGAVPIGQPIANTRLYVMDERGELVAAGMRGELRIAGSGVARGYLNNAAATALKVVPAEGGEAGERAYRSGDRVRWRASGELGDLGRGDRQVKGGGYRVGVGEV